MNITLNKDQVSSIENACPFGYKTASINWGSNPNVKATNANGIKLDSTWLNDNCVGKTCEIKPIISKTGAKLNSPEFNLDISKMKTVIGEEKQSKNVLSKNFKPTNSIANFLFIDCEGSFTNQGKKCLANLPIKYSYNITNPDYLITTGQLNFTCNEPPTTTYYVAPTTTHYVAPTTTYYKNL